MLVIYMDIELLRPILDSAKNKKDAILFFVDETIKKTLQDLYLEETQFYIHDIVYAVSKSTLDIDIIGRVLIVEDERLGIKKNKYSTVYIEKDNYYLFIKCSKKVSHQREMLEKLLSQL